MKTLNVREAREAIGRLDDLLSQEGEITITRHGRAIARVVPVGRKRTVPSNRDLRASLPRMRVGSEILIRKDRDGR